MPGKYRRLRSAKCVRVVEGEFCPEDFGGSVEDLENS